MKNLLGNTKTLIVEILALLAGFLWARQTNTSNGPIILIVISALGILIFLIIRSRSGSITPVVDLKLSAKGASRSLPGMIPNISPKEHTGKNYVVEIGGTYLFEVSRDFELVIQNSSKNSAHNLVLYKPKTALPIEFKRKNIFSEPLLEDKPQHVELTYRVKRPMTHNDADKILKDKVPEDLNNVIFIASYQNRRGKTYYTTFRLPDTNQRSQVNIDLNNFEMI